MGIEVHTLYLLSATISLLLGFLLLVSWRLNGSVPALGLWGAGIVIFGVGLALVAARGSIPDIVSIVVANAVSLVGAAVVWSGTRVFDGRAVLRSTIVAGPLVWVAACIVPVFYGSINARAILVFAILLAYTVASAFELWRGRALPLVSRWPTIVLLGVQSLLIVVRIGLIIVMPLQEGLPGSTGNWFLVAHYEALLYEIALAFAFFAMAKERGGQRLVIAGARAK
jgi:hypothetical protein